MNEMGSLAFLPPLRQFHFFVGFLFVFFVGGSIGFCLRVFRVFSFVCVFYLGGMGGFLGCVWKTLTPPSSSCPFQLISFPTSFSSLSLSSHGGVWGYLNVHSALVDFLGLFSSSLHY
jgi:hypothetical protein